MKILVVIPSFYPELSAPATRWKGFSEYFIERGDNITILTLANDADRADLGSESSGVGLSQVSYDSAPFGATKNHFCKAVNNLFFVGWSLRKFKYIDKPDLVIGSSPYLSCAVIGLLFARFWSVPFVFEIRDLWHESWRLLAPRYLAFLWRLFWAIERLLVSCANRIIVVSPMYRDFIPSSKLVGFCPNGWVSKQPSSRTPSSDCGDSSKLLVVYGGNFGVAQDLVGLVTYLLKNSSSIRDCIRFEFYGNGAQEREIRRLVDQDDNDFISIYDSVSKEMLFDRLRTADLGLINLVDGAEFLKVIPSKIFDYMACDLAIIAGVGGITADIIRDNDFGFVYQPGDYASLTELLIEVSGHRGQLQQKKDMVNREKYRYSLSNSFVELRGLLDANA